MQSPDYEFIVANKNADLEGTKKGEPLQALPSVIPNNAEALWILHRQSFQPVQRHAEPA